MDAKSILNNLKETPPRELNDHILLVDSLNTLIRSFTLIKAINSQGHHVGGLVGFLRSIGFLARTQDPTRMICVFDGKGGSQNRKNIDPNYKSQRTGRITNWGLYESREEESESLTAQLERLLDYLMCLPVHSLMLEKLEADDVIAFIAKLASNRGKKVTIVSTDKDFLQLIDENISVYSPIKKETITQYNVREKIGVHPKNYNILKALTGDNSDNLPGVRGLGVKTLVKEFPDLVTNPDCTLNYVYEVAEKNLEGKKVFSKIIHEWDVVEKNFQLMDLHEGSLDNDEKDHIFDVLSSPVPELRIGSFMSLLDMDRIDGITKNTDGWMENFRGLTLYKR